MNIAGWKTWMPSLKAQGSRGSRFTANADADLMINGEPTYLNETMNHFLYWTPRRWNIAPRHVGELDDESGGLAFMDKIGRWKER